VRARSSDTASPADAIAARPIETLLRDGAVLASAQADRHGIPVRGREDELALLRVAGYRDLAFGRLFEGHGNALSLVARCGTAAQRTAATRDAASGRLFGVWNTQANDGVRMVPDGGRGWVLAGRKTFCSGAGTVTRALITAAGAEPGSQMILVPMDRVDVGIDRSFWQPLGMEASDSFAVAFDGVTVARDALVGRGGDYERQPWFGAGAARFVAVQAGGTARLVDELVAFVTRRGGGDAVAVTRLGECVVAARGADLWVRACADAWAAFDAESDSARERELQCTVDAARTAVERAALDVMERVERAVGARGLLASEPFAALIRDLRMYLRQPAPDLAVRRVGEDALARSARA